MKLLPKLTIVQGDDKTLVFDVFDLSVDPRGRTLANLNGYSATWRLTRRGTKGYFKDGVLEIAGVITGSQISVTVPGSQLVSLLGNFYQQLEIDDGQNHLEIVAAGDVQIDVRIAVP